MSGILSGRRIVVLGGSSGLGEAVARGVVEKGGKVLIVARNQAGLDEVAESLPSGTVSTLAADITQEAMPAALAQKVTELWGHVDGAFLSHGGPPGSNAADLDDDLLRSSIELAAIAPIRLLRTIAPLASPGASLIALTSSTGYEPMPGMAASNIARPMVQAYVKTLARELGPRNVRVNVLVPGRFATPRLTQLDSQGVAVTGQIPLGRAGEPSELAAVACFLLSSEASYVTGASWTVDGGRRVTL